MRKELRWLKLLKIKSKINIFTDDVFKTTLVLESVDDNDFVFKSESKEMQLMVLIDRKIKGFHFSIQSYLWLKIVSQHAESILNVRLENDNLIINSSLNSYILEKI